MCKWGYRQTLEERRGSHNLDYVVHLHQQNPYDQAYLSDAK
jgi:hypothetical protein